VWRGVPVGPMTGRDAEPRDPMHLEAALGAVQHPRLELALEIGLHLQQLEPEHLRVDSDRVIAATGGPSPRQRARRP